MLVLLLRGELLRRYPTTAIYAVKGRWVDPAPPLPPDAPRPREPGTLEMYPEFRGNLEPDIVFLGFPLSVWEARGSESEPGWYFVLQEQPTAPRFGFDELKPPGKPDRFGGRPAKDSWSNLEWGQLVKDEADYRRMSHAPVEGELLNPALRDPPPIGNASWGADSAHMAEITLQQPVRIAVHAARMLGDADDVAERVTTAARDDGLVTAIGGLDSHGQSWRLSADEAVDALERAARGFYVERSDGERRRVIAAGAPDDRRLTTAAAAGEANLLLDLPED